MEIFNVIVCKNLPAKVFIENVAKSWEIFNLDKPADMFDKGFGRII